MLQTGQRAMVRSSRRLPLIDGLSVEQFLTREFEKRHTGQEFYVIR
jgi:hypothetical protein